MNPTATKLMDTGQALIQERGYNAFSYKDLAVVVGIRTASIHYHFPSKAELGLAITERYTARLTQSLAEIEDKHSDPVRRLKAFIALYATTESCGAICLCGSLASDRETLPNPLRAAVDHYLDTSERWLAREIQRGVKAGTLSFSGKAADAASLLLASLQGALLLARAHERPTINTIQRTFFRLVQAN